ncbi:unnamed protein product [Mytilus edulis]|uniref:Uncharacterized protein n=1 Tax=Mytilus edulis TaxID=6550 RepID=A0A8S3QFS3_MYTED|nr:unnamed protein product [Mytilus edulis]
MKEDDVHLVLLQGTLRNQLDSKKEDENLYLNTKSTQTEWLNDLTTEDNSTNDVRTVHRKLKPGTLKTYTNLEEERNCKIKALKKSKIQREKQGQQNIDVASRKKINKIKEIEMLILLHQKRNQKKVAWKKTQAGEIEFDPSEESKMLNIESIWKASENPFTVTTDPIALEKRKST